MKPGKRGKATGPPRLGRAIIGATLLLRSDAFAPSDPLPQDDASPEAARGDRQAGAMPGTGFGAPGAAGKRAEAGKSTAATVKLEIPAPSQAPSPAKLPTVSEPRPDRQSATAAREQPETRLPGRRIAGPVGPIPARSSGKSPANVQRRVRARLPAEAPARVPAYAAEPARSPQPGVSVQPEISAPPEAAMGPTGATAATPPAMPEPVFGAGAQPPAPATFPARTPALLPPEQAPAPQLAPDPPPHDPLPSPAYGGDGEAAGVQVPPVSVGTSPSGPVLQIVDKPEAAPAPPASAAELVPIGSSAAPIQPDAQPDAEPGATPDTTPEVTPGAAPDAAGAALPESTLPDVGFGTRAAPQPPGPGPAAVGLNVAAPEAANDNAGVAGTSLPEPAFGASAERPAPARAPVRLAVAELPPQPEGMPKPDFGTAAPSPATQPSVGLVPSRGATAAPLTGSVPAPSASGMPLPGQAERAGYADTSPRMPGDPAPSFSIDDELILQLQTVHGELADTITAYGTRSAVYLPLGAVARFLDLAISVSDEGHYASGWFIDESQTMSINLRQGTLVVKGQELALHKGDAAAFEGELYLRAERFADLFPLSVTVDLRAQTVTVKTRVPFPFEQRFARDEERARLAGGAGRGPRRFPREETPWQALSFPLADVELRGVSDSTYGHRAEGDIRVAGDLAFMTARVFASATSRDGLTGARIQLGRRDPDGGLIGPFDATEFQIGDVTTAAMPLGLRGIGGRGAFLTNAPLERASVFETIDLRGELPEGYEVELYRNNVLVGSTRTPVNGQYEFLKTSVDYGLNIFRLVYFGPQGQRREEVRRVSVGDGRLSKGEFVYTVGGAQKDVNVFDVHGPGFTRGLDHGTWRGTALMEYGLSRELTAALGGAWYESRFGKQWLATAGLRTGIGGTALKLDLGYISSGGKAVQAGLGGRLGGATYTLTHAEYSGGFTDEVRSFSADPLRRATELNVNAAIKLRGGDQPLLLPLYGQLRRIAFADGRKQTDATLRGSLPLSSLMFSNTLSFAGTSTPGSGSTSQLRGIFDLATLNGSRLQLRAGIDYGVLPRLRLEGGTIEANYALDERTLVRASVGHTLVDSHTSFGLSAVRRFGKFNVAFDGSYGVPDRTYSAALRLGFSFGRNPLNGRVFFAEPGLAGGGAIAARAYRDSNGNRLFDQGEEAIPAVDFFAGSRHGKSDAQGVVLLGDLGDGNRASMTVERESLPDISLAPVTDGIEVVPRAGRVHVTGFPVQELSEIDGTAYFSEGGSLGREVSGLRLLLADGEGKPVARARTEGDGTFFFEQVPPGTYAIQIDANQAASLKIHLSEPITVTIGAKAGYLKQVVKVSAD